MEEHGGPRAQAKFSLSLAAPKRKARGPVSKASVVPFVKEPVDNEGSVQRTTVTELGEIGREATELVIPCAHRLKDERSAPHHSTGKPRLVYNLAGQGRLEWEKSEKALSSAGALAPPPTYGLVKRPPAASRLLLKATDAVPIGKPTQFELPASSFGLAMLRGMGFDPTKDSVPVIEPRRRQRTCGGLLGVGADVQVVVGGGGKKPGEDEEVFVENGTQLQR